MDYVFLLYTNGTCVRGEMLKNVARFYNIKMVYILVEALTHFYNVETVHVLVEALYYFKLVSYSFVLTILILSCHLCSRSQHKQRMVAFADFDYSLKVGGNQNLTGQSGMVTSNLVMRRVCWEMCNKCARKRERSQKVAQLRCYPSTNFMILS